MIDKLLFCTVIENLRQQIYLNDTFGEAVQEMFSSGCKCSYNDDLLIISIMSLLHIHFPRDENGFSEIEHYCFTIDFGKLENNEIITAEDLYDSLISNLKK